MVQLFGEKQSEPFNTIFRDLKKRKLEDAANIYDKKTMKYHFKASMIVSEKKYEFSNCLLGGTIVLVQEEENKFIKYQNLSIQNHINK